MKKAINFEIDEDLKAHLDKYVASKGMTIRGFVTALIKRGTKWSGAEREGKDGA